MKKTSLFLLTLLLCTTTIHAKYIKAVLYMEDGTIKKGLSEKVELNDSKVKFRTDENAKTEKISSADIKKIEYTNEENLKITVERLYVTTANILTGKFSKSSKKKWMYIIDDKNVKIGYIYEAPVNRPNAAGTSRVIMLASTAYYFGKKDSDALVFGFVGGSTVTIGADSLIRKMSREAFADCPKIIDVIEKTNFKVKSAVEQLQTIFEKNKCK
ncbi:hypothetical protein [Flavobacterium adhaerens]|uniref:hypothetical protein n=1 Tax=Flavobacterium adhaerens TaxID=3149043 RepID=UPI0032B37D42